MTEHTSEAMSASSREAGSGPSPVREYRASGMRKSFGGTRALDEVDFRCLPGEVHALLGANGAGKSTLVKILSGIMRPDSGTLYLDGEAIRFRNGREARSNGIALVSQELSLYPDLTVMENLFLGRESLHGGAVTAPREMRRRALPVLDAVGLQHSVLERPLRSLAIGAQQLVEIARALLEEPRVLILDEPTSALKAAQTRRLLQVVKELRTRDVAIVFVSHFLEDVFDVADVVTILRSGKVVNEATPLAHLTPDAVIRSMLGKALAADADVEETSLPFPIPPAPKDLGPLVFERASCRVAFEDVSFEVQPGEVVGLAGLEGSGAGDVLRVLFGRRKLIGGKVLLPNGGGVPRSTRAAVRAGVAYVPADRKATGLILDQSIYENVSMVTAGPLRRLGFLPSRRAKAERVRAWQDPVGLVMASPAMPVSSLSGGNQQKVVFAKWLEPMPSLVLLDDPTRGVDVGAKADMMQLIRAVAASGRVVLYTSTDLEEMSRVCDRVLVFYRRRVVGELRTPLTEHRLLDAVTRGVLAPPVDASIDERDGASSQ